MKKIKRLLIALCFMLALAGATCVFAQSDKDEDKIKKGVKIDSIDVGGMTASEAKKAVKKAVKNKISANVSITVNDEIINASLEDLGYEWANEEVVDEAGTWQHIFDKNGKDLTAQYQSITKNEAPYYHMTVDSTETFLNYIIGNKGQGIVFYILLMASNVLLIHIAVKVSEMLMGV